MKHDGVKLIANAIASQRKLIGPYLERPKTIIEKNNNEVLKLNNLLYPHTMQMKGVGCQKSGYIIHLFAKNLTRRVHVGQCCIQYHHLAGRVV